MGKLSLGTLLMGIVVLLCTLLPAAQATSPVAAEGTFDYTFEVIDMKEANGNTWLYAIEYEDWVGSFEGISEAVFRVELFSAGFWNVWLRSTFTGTVLGAEGTVVIQLVGKKAEGADWFGQWVILSGTGELANLHGQGTWWGPGFGPVSPMIYYSGQIHFEAE